MNIIKVLSQIVISNNNHDAINIIAQKFQHISEKTAKNIVTDIKELINNDNSHDLNVLLNNQKIIKDVQAYF